MLEREQSDMASLEEELEALRREERVSKKDCDDLNFFFHFRISVDSPKELKAPR